jgi:hypothetical protein
MFILALQQYTISPRVIEEELRLEQSLDNAFICPLQPTSQDFRLDAVSPSPVHSQLYLARNNHFQTCKTKPTAC